MKYNDIITNSVILQNIIDMSDIIHKLTQEGAQIRENDIGQLEPLYDGAYQTFWGLSYRYESHPRQNNRSKQDIRICSVATESLRQKIRQI